MIGIIGDTGTDIPPMLYERDYVEVVPLKVILDDVVLKDGERDEFPKIIKYMETGFPKTTLPSFNEVKEKMLSLVDRGIKEILAFNLSNKLSGTYNIFRLVAEEIMKEQPDIRIELFDTLDVSIGCANYIVKANQMIEAGKGFDEIVSYMREAIPSKSTVFFTIPTIKFLKAGGRIGRVSGTIAEILNIKPVIRCDDDGVYITAGKARGLKKAYKMVKENAYKIIRENDVRICGLAWTGNAPETLQEIERIKKDLKELGVEMVYGHHINATLFVNTGLELIGVAPFIE
ncbi:MAG TPA: DegV family protein [Thermotogota bacterium]|nr:DegV family protein [Thermotogota bacterium]HPJ89296.1 DegV family protein [Thermotogota bacterium]HPR95167.1 DegV family protein [Thermotogota bacterium]